MKAIEMRALQRVFSLFLISLMGLIITMVAVRQRESGAMWLAYASDRNGTWDIYRQIGKQDEQLTDLPTIELTPFWSPDGKSIYFISENGSVVDIFTKNLTNGSYSVITNLFPLTASFPSISADEAWFLFTAYSREGNNYDIFQYSLKHTEVTPIIHSEGDDRGASISPDGSSILYFSRAVDEEDQYLYLLSLVDKTVRRIEVDDVSFADPYPATWSPDGEWIAFGARQGGYSNIYRYQLGSGRLEQLTADLADSFGPAWSPDGRWIAFSSWRDGRLNLYRMHPDGSTIERLTDDDYFELYPAWSPLIDLPWDLSRLLGVVWLLTMMVVGLALMIGQRESMG